VRLKSKVKSALRAVGLRRPRSPWVVAEDQPAQPEPLASFGLYAIVVTWMEADVIGATVRNAFTQGCERVLLVDNDSPDGTVAAATDAGAELAASFSTPQLDELLKVRLLNETVASVSAASGHDHIWWLWLDADEFVHGPQGSTVRELLSSLDRHFRIVGTRYFNHYPDRRPEYLTGWHPLDFQPLCEERIGNLCAVGHRKHNLQRWDRRGPPITSGLGFHSARCEVTLSEPTIDTYTHHFPYRLQEVTRRRLDALCGRDGGGQSRVALHDRQVRRNAGTDSDMTKRYRTLSRVYARDWAHIDNLRRRGARIGVQLRPWTSAVGSHDAQVARWYASDELEAALVAWRRAADASA
jgi:hypothetical protein